MARRQPIARLRHFRRTLILPTFASIGVLFGAAPSNAAEPLPPTHEAFVDSALRDLATNILSEFHPNRTRPLVIDPDTIHDPLQQFAGAVAEILAGHGMLIRERDEGDGWALRYVFDSASLTFTNPQRREFLGSVWIQRNYHPLVTVTIQDQVDAVEVWRHTADTTYTDWIRRRDLKQLVGSSSGRVPPSAPNNAWDRAVIPIVTGLAATALTVTFLVLR